jgi:hypothetical protein
MPDDKRYRECMAEIIGVLHKYDMAGAITVVSKERAMFRYFFPSWSCILLADDHVRFRSKRKDYPSAEAQHQATELSAHIVMQMHDIALNTVTMMGSLGTMLTQKLGMTHTPGADFDPERNQ